MLLNAIKEIKAPGSCNIKKDEMNLEYIYVIYIGWVIEGFTEGAISKIGKVAYSFPR